MLSASLARHVMLMRRKFVHRLLVLVPLAFAIPDTLWSQEPAPGDLAGDSPSVADDRATIPPGRPSIGLVLSGGGARGGAHLGALQALEELRVPIDYIAGTSIGAAIGGIYASGLSVDEVLQFLESIDWDAAFLNQTPRALRSFRRKRDDDLFLVDQRWGLNEGEFELPTGVVQGQVIDTIMARVMLPVTGVTDFDRLAIPFRAVAGDLETGEAVVLGTGDMGRAVRASMTVPAALSPMAMDGRLLVDGGIAMNLPVEVAEQMGADVIVAVDISEQLLSREELRSVVDVTSQLTNMLTRRATERQLDRLDDDDVLIRPEFTEELSSISFSRITETIPLGYQSVMANRAELERHSLSAEAYAAHVAARRNPRTEELPVIDFVRLNNESPIADSVLRARMAEIEAGERLDVDGLETSLNRLYGLGLYQNIRYEVVEEEPGTGLALDFVEREWGPNYLQLGMQYSSASDEDAVFGLAASYLRTAIDELGAEWRATISVGDEPAFLADRYQPLGPRALYFVAPSMSFESDLLNVYQDGVLGAEIQLREALLEFSGGRELMDRGEIRVGLRTGYGETDLRVGDAALVPFDDYRRAELFTRFSVDTFDDISFPRQGVLATAEWRGSRDGTLSADATFDQLLLEAAVANTWGRHTVLSTMRYDTTVSGTAPVYALPRIGGFFDLSGLNSRQLSGQHVARVGAGYYRRIGDLALFPAFAGVTIEAGNAWSSRSEISLDNSIYGASLWAGVDTPVGPIYLAYGVAEGGENAFYVFLGRVF